MQSKAAAEPIQNRQIDAVHQEVIAKIARKYTFRTSICWEDAAQTAKMKVYEAVKAGKFHQGGIAEFQRWATVVAKYEILNFVKKESLRSHQSLDATITGTDVSLVDTNYHGLVNRQPEINDIEGLGLKVGKRKALDVAEIALFHQTETAWSDVLTIPVAAHNRYIKSANLTNKILSDCLQIEQEFIEVEFNQNRVINSLSNSFNQTQIILSRWWQNIFEPEWQAFSTFPNLVIATRSHSDSQNIQQTNILELIQQLSAENDESQRQSAAKQLGEIAVGCSDAVQALVNLLRSTSDDETLWIAVESLRKIDPENPAAGIRRVRLIDLGMEIAGEAVALSVALLQKVEGDVSVLLQVYPTGNDDYLPADLKLILIDDSGNILREITARKADVYMQLKFSCEVGERFSVQVALSDTNFRETFVV